MKIAQTLTDDLRFFSGSFLKTDCEEHQLTPTNAKNGLQAKRVHFMPRHVVMGFQLSPLSPGVVA